MIEVEKIRKALEPYREDLAAVDWARCAVGRILGFRHSCPDFEEARRRCEAAGLPYHEEPDGRIGFLDGSPAIRIIRANDRAPNGFARYQAVMAECAKIRREQEEAARGREAVTL